MSVFVHSIISCIQLVHDTMELKKFGLSNHPKRDSPTRFLKFGFDSSELHTGTQLTGRAVFALNLFSEKLQKKKSRKPYLDSCVFLKLFLFQMHIEKMAQSIKDKG